MKKTFYFFICCLSFVACHKASDTTQDDFSSTETTVLTDFTNYVALDQYNNLKTAAHNLNTDITALNNNATEDNLTASRNSWKALRQIWEQCEGFLFGPVEDNDYDPQMDTWPTDQTQFDSLLASNNALEVADIQALPLNLRGFHPIEYLIFGKHSDRMAENLTARQKKYMVSATIDLVNNCESLYASWIQEPVNFQQQVLSAGAGSTVYATKQEAFMAMTGAMEEICEEVGQSKMKAPFDARNPKIVESPYSGNSTEDFKNNITGLQSVYLGRTGGDGITNLVTIRNKSLDIKIRSQITAAINSFDNITEYFEDAIIDQRTQVQQSIDAVNSLDETIEEELVPFIQQQIKD